MIHHFPSPLPVSQDELQFLQVRPKLLPKSFLVLKVKKTERSIQSYSACGS